jgi:hypothetical protein
MNCPGWTFKIHTRTDAMTGDEVVTVIGEDGNWLVKEPNIVGDSHAKPV